MSIREFLRLESASGIVLMGTAALAVLLANLPVASVLDAWLATPLNIGVGAFALEKPILLWINDGLMACFFLLVGLEIKREFGGERRTGMTHVLLPASAALGGMLVPAAVYALVQGGDPRTLHGWAIPAATDIAFALGILTLVGSRAPRALKILLTAVAIIDDIGAIAIIAIFYTAHFALAPFAAALAFALALFGLNKAGVTRLWPYLLLGGALWVAVLKSGVHATLAGVVVAFAIPLRGGRPDAQSPLVRLEHALHPWIAFGVLPVFALANAGVSLRGLTADALCSPISLGIALGLLVGKPIGILLFAWIPVRAGWTKLPAGVGMPQLTGLALLAGVGFTMSLFIGNLAFPDPAVLAEVRLGVLAASLIAGTAGFLALRRLSNAADPVVRPGPAR